MYFQSLSQNLKIRGSNWQLKLPTLPAPQCADLHTGSRPLQRGDCSSCHCNLSTRWVSLFKACPSFRGKPLIGPMQSHAHPWTAPSVSRGRILMKGQVQVTTVNLRFVSQLQSLYCKFPPFSLGSQNWSLLFGVKRTLVQAESSHDPKEEKEKASLNITSQEYHPYFCSKNFNDGYLHIPKMDSNCNMKYKMCIILYTLDEKPKISTKNCYSLLLILGKNYILRIYDFHTQNIYKLLSKP